MQILGSIFYILFCVSHWQLFYCFIALCHSCPAYYPAAVVFSFRHDFLLFSIPLSRRIFVFAGTAGMAGWVFYFMFAVGMRMRCFSCL